MSKRSRPNLNVALRRLRALRVCLGERRFRWRPLDTRPGRPRAGFPRIVKTKCDFLRLAHSWLNACCPGSESHWFYLEELAYDPTGRYSVVVDRHNVLVYAETLWTGFLPPFICSDRRKAVCYG